MENFAANFEFLTVNRRTESTGGTDVSIILPKHQKQTANILNIFILQFTLYININVITVMAAYMPP